MKHRIIFLFVCFSMVLFSNGHCPVFLKLCFFLIFNLEMAQLGNYDSGTAETPETDESVSVSTFLDKICCLFCLLQLEILAVNYFICSTNVYCVSMRKALDVQF